MLSTKPIGRAASCALAVGCIVVPCAAVADLTPPKHGRAATAVRWPAAGPQDAALAGPTQQLPVHVVRVAHDRGFDWADAGIGAATMAGISMIGLGGALGASRRRARHSRRSTVVAG
jgi:hypothetical protein